MISKEPQTLNLNFPYDLERWARSAAHFANGIDVLRGTHQVSDLMLSVAMGHMHWFPGSNSSALVEVIDYPRMKVASAFLVCGEIEEIKAWVELDGPFDTWAKDQGCHRSQYVGRSGFARVFENVEHFGDLALREYT